MKQAAGVPGKEPRQHRRRQPKGAAGVTPPPSVLTLDLLLLLPQRRRADRGLRPRNGGVGAEEDAIRVGEEEPADPVDRQSPHVAEPGGHVHVEVRERVEAPAQGVEIVGHATEMRADDGEAGVAGKPAIPGGDHGFPARYLGVEVGIVLGVRAEVLVAGARRVERPPTLARVGAVHQNRDVPRREEVPDGLQSRVVDLNVSAAPIADHEAEILPDLEHDRAVGQVRAQPRQRPGREVGPVDRRRIEGRRYPVAVRRGVGQREHVGPAAAHQAVWLAHGVVENDRPGVPALEHRHEIAAWGEVVGVDVDLLEIFLAQTGRLVASTAGHEAEQTQRYVATAT